MSEPDTTADRDADPTIGPFTRRGYLVALGATSAVSSGASGAVGSVGPQSHDPPGPIGYGEGGYGNGVYGGVAPATVSDYADDDGVVRADGLLAAINDWRRDHIGTSLLLEVIAAWRSDEPVS